MFLKSSRLRAAVSGTTQIFNRFDRVISTEIRSGSRDFHALYPESCIFIDDTAENVKAVRELRFSGIVFTSCEALLTELKELGISL